MKRTVFILCHDLHSKNSVQNYAKRILQCAQNASDSEIFMLIKTGSDFDKPVCMLNVKEWITPQELQNLVTSSFEDCLLSTHNPRDGDQDLSSVLHKVADSLPYLGTLLGVVFIFGSCEEEDGSKCKSFLSVAGAMKRLTEWHNADAMLTSLASPIPSMGQKLVEFGIFRVVTGFNFPRRPLVGWAGNVVLMDKCESKGFVLPGYQLECADWSKFLQKKLSPLTCLPKKPRCKTRKHTSQQSTDVKQHVLGRCIEILQEIDLRTLPLFLLDNWTLLLSVKEGVSSSVFNYIQGLQQTGLLARLRIYNDVGEIPSCGQLRNLRTEAWKERITSNYCNLSEPEEMNIAHEYKYLYFVLLPLDPSKSGIQLSVKAQVLLSPHEINESIFQLFEGARAGNNTSISDSSHNSLDTKDELFIQPDRFITLLNIFSESPNLLPNKKDFTAIQEALVQKGFPEEYQAGNSTDIFDQIMLIPETTLSLEKRILEAKESARTVCQTSPYLHSLMSASPKTAIERNIDSWDFNVVDLLQSFKQSESLIPMATSPVKVKRRGFCRFESQPDFCVSWPNSQQLMAPDIYYYRDENDMLFEQTYAKIRDKSNNFDTMTTFMSPLKKKVKSNVTSSSSTLNRSSTRHLKGDLQRIKSLMSPSLPSSELPSTRQIPISRPKKAELPQKNSQLILESSKERKKFESLSSRLKRSESMTQQLRVSPRKLSKSLTKSSSTTDVQSKQRMSEERQKEVPSCDKNKSDKMKRSQRHKMKLQSIVENVLNDKGVKKGDKIFDACSRNLFNVSLVLLKTFTSSRNLTEEMKNVVCGQVDQIISLEVRRSSKGR